MHGLLDGEAEAVAAQSEPLADTEAQPQRMKEERKEQSESESESESKAGGEGGKQKKANQELDPNERVPNPNAGGASRKRIPRQTKHGTRSTAASALQSLQDTVKETQTKSEAALKVIREQSEKHHQDVLETQRAYNTMMQEQFGAFNTTLRALVPAPGAAVPVAAPMPVAPPPAAASAAASVDINALLAVLKALPPERKVLFAEALKT